MDQIVPIFLFLMIFGICAVVTYFQHRNRADLQLTVRAAIESGQPLSAEVLEGLTAALRPQKSDLRRGVVLVTIALGFCALAFGVGEPDAFGPLLGVSAFPGLTGLGYIGLWLLNRDPRATA
jgi:hypothetical protein